MTRKVCLDIAKGLGIGLVVLGHLIDYFGAEISGVYSFIYLFHVPLFFPLSGMFFKREDSFRFFFEEEIHPSLCPLSSGQYILLRCRDNTNQFSGRLI